jgi:hypothetical protein
VGKEKVTRSQQDLLDEIAVSGRVMNLARRNAALLIAEESAQRICSSVPAETYVNETRAIFTPGPSTITYTATDQTVEATLKIASWLLGEGVP